MSDNFPEDLRRAIDSTAKRNSPGPVPKVPPGWEPRLDVEQGVICYTSHEPIEDHDWASLVQHFGFKPELFTIDPTTLRASAWEQRTRDGVSTILHAYKAQIVPRGPSSLELACVHERLKRIRKVRPAQGKPAEQTFVFSLSDIQPGKRDAYDPSDTTKTIDGVNRTLDRLAQLPALFDRVYDGSPEVVIALPGDNIENCTGSYAHQQFVTTINKVEQRELCADGIDVLIDHVARKPVNVTVAAVGGNHGENRGTSSRYVTDEADNDDIAIVRSLMRAYDKAAKFDNLTWLVPHRELDITFTLPDSTIMTLAHGHQFKTKGGAFPWWKGQMLGRLPAGNSHFLLTGHYHSFVLEQPTDERTWIQSPAFEAASHYFRDKAGLWFPTGAVLGVTTSHGEILNVTQARTP